MVSVKAGAAPRLASAPAAVVAPVPPCPISSGLVGTIVPAVTVPENVPVVAETVPPLTLVAFVAWVAVAAFPVVF